MMVDEVLNGLVETLILAKKSRLRRKDFRDNAVTRGGNGCNFFRKLVECG